MFDDPADYVWELVKEKEDQWQTVEYQPEFLREPDSRLVALAEKREHVLATNRQPEDSNLVKVLVTGVQWCS